MAQTDRGRDGRTGRKKGETMIVEAEFAYEPGFLAAKIENEGGIQEAIEFGICSSQIGDPGLKLCWAALEELQKHVDQVEEKFWNRMEVLGESRPGWSTVPVTR